MLLDDGLSTINRHLPLDFVGTFDLLHYGSLSGGDRSVTVRIELGVEEENFA